MAFLGSCLCLSWLGLTWLGVAWFGVGLVGGLGGGGREIDGVPANEAYVLGPAKLAVGGNCSFRGAWL